MDKDIKFTFIGNGILWVKGAVKSAIYDLREKYVDIYWLDEEASKVIQNFLKGIMDNSVHKFLKELSKLGINIEVNSSNIKKLRNIEEQINLKLAWIEVTNKCNLKCLHCYDSFQPENSNFISITNFAYILRSLQSVGCKNIQLIGGEPFLHPKISRLLELTYEHGFSCEIFTNGFFVNDDHIKLIKDYSFKLAISFYGSEEESYKVTGSKLYSKKFKDLINKLKANNINFRVAAILTSHNYNIQPLQGINFRSDIVRITGRADLRLLNRNLLKRKLITEKTFKKRIPSNRILSNISVHNCFWEKIYIDSKLNIYPCVMERRISYGNLLKKTLHDILQENIKWLRLTKDNIEGCSACEFRYACFDCRPDSLDSNFLAKPWYCTYEPDRGKWINTDEFISSILVE